MSFIFIVLGPPRLAFVNKNVVLLLSSNLRENVEKRQQEKMQISANWSLHSTNIFLCKITSTWIKKGEKGQTLIIRALIRWNVKEKRELILEKDLHGGV